jgi:hypothetical protein
MEQDSHAASQADRNQDVIGDPDPKVRDPDKELPGAHAARR